MLRRLYKDQPDSFEFTPANLEWAKGQVAKYPEGRQASAVIPLLWRAQEQYGWTTRPIVEYIADMLSMDKMRVFEVASFYFMFQLQPVGSVAHIQVCGTTSCMICGAEKLIEVCKEKIASKPHTVSENGKLSWEEVECLGACTNAPMAQIGKDYYEDLSAERFAEIIDALEAGDVPVPGPQNGRYASEPLSGLTSLTDYDSGKTQYNASAELATDIGDTVKRIDGTEVPLLTPWIEGTSKKAKKPAAKKPAAPKKAAPKKTAAKAAAPVETASVEEAKPVTLTEARSSGADDLKLLKGVGPKLEQTLNELGFYHFDQVAKWTDAEVQWVDSRLKFKGRIVRDNWIEQAKTLAEGGETEFSNKVKKGSAK